MKRIVAVLALCSMAVFLSGAQSGGALSSAWKHWQFSAPIAAPLVDAPALWGVKIPRWVSARWHGDGADLRVVDANGAEVPFVLHAKQEKRARVMREGKLYDVSFQPGANTQGIVDLGPQPGDHNSLVVQTSEANYFTHIELAISNDARDWRLVRDRVPIYRFAAERLDGNQTVPYPASRARYLRMRILQAEKQFPLTGIQVAQETVEAAETERIDGLVQRDPASPAQQSWWTLDAGSSHEPVSSVRFEVEQPEFHRAVRIRATHTPENPRSWFVAGEGDVYRYRRGGELYEKLSVTFTETRARQWRAEIFNRNDPEITGLKLAFYGTPRRAVFSAKPGTAYRLAYGNSAARPASYEMARLIETPVLESAAAATLGAEEANPAYEDPNPLPWSERHPYVLWGAALLAVAVLGTLALRAMRPS